MNQHIKIIEDIFNIIYPDEKNLSHQEAINLYNEFISNLNVKEHVFREVLIINDIEIAVGVIYEDSTITCKVYINPSFDSFYELNKMIEVIQMAQELNNKLKSVTNNLDTDLIINDYDINEIIL